MQRNTQKTVAAVSGGEKIFSTAGMTLMALFTAVTCILAPLSIPIGPVPISLTSLVIYISVYILGWKRGLITYLVYLFVGIAGLPVFSGMTGGIGKLAGPTGGYLVGFIFTVILCGLFVEKGNGRWYVSFIGMILGTAVLYAFGTAWFCISTGTVLLPALELCVFPFLIGDFIKMALAVLTGPRLAARIKGAAV